MTKKRLKGWLISGPLEIIRKPFVFTKPIPPELKCNQDIVEEFHKKETTQ